MTVMPVLFAIFINAAVTSLTWLTLPGAELMVSVYMVCMESMITSPGFSANIIADIASKLDAETMNRSRLFTFSLSALSLIWLADSSPDMYNMPASVFRVSHICRSSVDFPMPGSPPTSISDPLTTPPPSTRSNSFIPVWLRCSLSVFISSRLTGFDWAGCHAEAWVFDSCRSSANVFHFEHAGHLPSQPDDSYPHSWHMKTVLFFAMTVPILRSSKYCKAAINPLSQSSKYTDPPSDPSISADTAVHHLPAPGQHPPVLMHLF